MIRSNALILACLALLLPAPCVAADFGTARGLADTCKALLATLNHDIPDSVADADVAAYSAKGGMCLGFLMGFRRGAAMGEANGATPIFCIPKDVADDQIARVLVKNVDLFPEVENATSAPFLAAVLNRTWPCPAH